MRVGELEGEADDGASLVLAPLSYAPEASNAARAQPTALPVREGRPLVGRLTAVISAQRMADAAEGLKLVSPALEWVAGSPTISHAMAPAMTHGLGRIGIAAAPLDFAQQMVVWQAAGMAPPPALFIELRVVSLAPDIAAPPPTPA